MAASVALVVPEERGVTPSDLERALREDGFETRYSDPAELARRPDLYETVDLVLASASLGLQQVALINLQLATATAPPALMVFPQHDLDLLESCVRGGFDYVVPPFLPALLRSRLSSCRERNQLAEAVEERATTARLHQYERELSIAREIQSGVLPDQPPRRH